MVNRTVDSLAAIQFSFSEMIEVQLKPEEIRLRLDIIRRELDQELLWLNTNFHVNNMLAPVLEAIKNIVSDHNALDLDTLISSALLIDDCIRSQSQYNII